MPKRERVRRTTYLHFIKKLRRAKNKEREAQQTRLYVNTRRTLERTISDSEKKKTNGRHENAQTLFLEENGTARGDRCTYTILYCDIRQAGHNSLDNQIVDFAPSHSSYVVSAPKWSFLSASACWFSRISKYWWSLEGSPIATNLCIYLYIQTNDQDIRVSRKQ